MIGRYAGTWIKVMETTLVAMVFVLPLAFYLKTYDSVAVKATVFQAGAVVLALTWLLKSLEFGRFEASRRVLPFLAPAAALLAWTAGVFIVSPYKTAALPGFLTQVLSILIYALVVCEFGGADNVQRVMDWLLGAAWVACFLGPATFGNPDLFAVFLALSLPLALTRLMDPEASTFSRVANAALVPVLGVVLARAGSAEGVAALCVQAVAFSVTAAVLLPLRAAWRPMVAAGVLAVVVLFRSGAPVEENLVVKSEFKRNTWAATLKMIDEKPWVGHGPGSFQVHYPRFQPPEFFTDHPESQALETAAELGWPGAALLLLVFAQVLFAAGRAYRQFARLGALREAIATAGLAAAVAGQLLVEQFGLASHYLMPGWLLWALAGLLAGLTTLASEAPTVTVPLDLQLPDRRKLYGPALTVALAALVMPALWLRSDLDQYAAVMLSKEGKTTEALARYDAVLPGAPSYVAAQYSKGNLLLDKGTPEQALEQFAKVAAIAPDYLQLHHRQGNAYAKLGDWENAIKSYEAHAKLDPLYVPNFLRLAEAHRAIGDTREARKAALAAIALEPEQASHWSVLAQIYMKDKRLTAGRRMQKEAARLTKLNAATGDER